MDGFLLSQEFKISISSTKTNNRACVRVSWNLSVKGSLCNAHEVFLFSFLCLRVAKGEGEARGGIEYSLGLSDVPLGSGYRNALQCT